MWEEEYICFRKGLYGKVRKPQQVPRSCWPACPPHPSQQLSWQRWVPAVARSWALLPVALAGEWHRPVCCSPGPIPGMKQNTAGVNKCCLLLDQLGRQCSVGGARVQECLPVPWGSAGRGQRLPGLLPATWHSPISIISRQRHAPFAAHGATRQAASRGSVLAGF